MSAELPPREFISILNERPGKIPMTFTETFELIPSVMKKLAASHDADGMRALSDAYISLARRLAEAEDEYLSPLAARIASLRTLDFLAPYTDHFNSLDGNHAHALYLTQISFEGTGTKPGQIQSFFRESLGYTLFNPTLN